MSTLVERLRTRNGRPDGFGIGPVCDEAADRIAELEAALRDLLVVFPLFDEEGLDEDEHCCEWSLQQDRKRLHAMLKAAPGGER